MYKLSPWLVSGSIATIILPETDRKNDFETKHWWCQWLQFHYQFGFL